MVASAVYQQIFQTECLSELKALRDKSAKGQWYQGHQEQPSFNLNDDLCRIHKDGDAEFVDFAKQCEKIIEHYLLKTIFRLLGEYRIPGTPLAIKRSSTPHFAFEVEGESFSVDSPVTEGERLFSLATPDYLYIFKRFGFQNRLPDEAIRAILERFPGRAVRYVSLVKENAFLEVLNHSSDTADPERGSGAISLKHFIATHFGEEEYDAFSKAFDHMADEITDYCGYKVVKTLRPNSIRHFRREVLHEMRAFSYSKSTFGKIISKDQKNLLEHNFFVKGNHEIATGNSDFAHSFMTAEWLYQSLEGAEEIDLSAILLGYFKSVEQLLFQIIKLRRFDADRSIYLKKVSRNKIRRKNPDGTINENDFITVDKLGYATLSEKLFESGFRENLTLSGLAGFFGHRSSKGELKLRNADLFVCGIEPETHAIVIDCLSEITGMRNGYLHKDNCHDWSEVDDAREMAFCVFYLLLGLLSISDKDAEELGFQKSLGKTDYYLLCDYIHSVACEAQGPTEFPIFYIDGNYEAPLFAHRDPLIYGYDNLGNPQYPGAYFGQNLKEGSDKIRFTESSMPRLIEEGVFVISKTLPFRFEASGPLHTVFKENRFHRHA